MKFLFAIALLFALVSGQSICTRYSAVLGINNNALVTTVVTGVFANITTAGSPLLHFFDGTTLNYPNGTMVDFRQASMAQTILVSHLVEFFGQALGCADMTIAAYTGVTMTLSHNFMAINHTQFVYFNQAVLGVMKGAGVNATDLAATNTVLETTRTGVCNDASCATICNRYSGALNLRNYDLVNTVVLGVFTNITTVGSPLVSFFDGSTVNFPGGMKVNFITAGMSQTVLVTHLIQFFGAALGCSDGTIGTYAGANMTAAHNFMIINNANFNYFNQAVLGVMRGAGVTAADLTSVLAVLETTRASICNQADCVATSAPSSGPSSAATSSATSAAATSASVSASKAGAGSLAPFIALLLLPFFLF